MATLEAYGIKATNGDIIKFRDDSGGGGSANSVRATYDTSPTTNPYSEGDYIYYNDTLYVTTTSITAGTALVVDTNIKDPDLPSDTIVSIDGLPGSGSGGGVTANDVSFDSTTSGLPATEVQTAIDVTDAEVDDIVNVYGSKNLFPVKAISKTIDGVTFTQNSDGSITITGTPNSAIGYPIGDGDNWNIYDLGWLKDLNGKTLELSGVTNKSGVQFSIEIYDAENQQICKWSTASGASRTAVCNTNGASHYRAQLYVYDTTKNYNVTVYPMLRLASVPDSTYEPYSMTNQQITKRLSGQSNRNFVDNPWFTINQRGFTTGSIATTAWTPTVDRWVALCENGGTATVNVNADKTITITDTTADPASNKGVWFIQRFEDAFTSASLIGKVVTLSILLSDGTLDSFTWTPTVGSEYNKQLPNGWYYGLVTRPHLGLQENYIRIHDHGVQGTATSSITIKAVKLELGSESTLAYDVAPDDATELAKCQRYQIAIPFVIGTLISTGVADSNGSIWFPISIGTVPRINYGRFSLLSGSIRVHDDTAYTEVTSSGSVSYNATCGAQGNILGIQIGGLTPLKTYSLDSSTGGTMLFDFNI